MKKLILISFLLFSIIQPVNAWDFAGFKNDVKTAKETFAATAEKDAPSAKFVDKCQHMMENPPEHWDGILRATEK